MNISIFDLYQSPAAPPHRHPGPYIYHSLSQSPLLSPDSCFFPEPLSPLQSTAISVHPSRLPTRNRQESLNWDLDARIEALREGIGSRRKAVGHRGSNAVRTSHSYAENQNYWKELRKRMGKKPDYQHRRQVSGTLKPEMAASLPQAASFYRTKLNRIDFSRKVHREEALRALGFSMRSRGKAAKLRERLDRQEGKVHPLREEGKRLNASVSLPKPARFNPSPFLLPKSFLCPN